MTRNDPFASCRQGRCDDCAGKRPIPRWLSQNRRLGSPIAADDQIARSASGGMDLDLRDAIFQAPVVEISGF
jgi:hypothetical protein